MAERRDAITKIITRATDSIFEILVYYVVTLIACALLFAYFEDKPVFESFWWACVTGLTIGYGDMYPATVGGKIVAIVLMHIVPLVIVPLIVTWFLTTVIEDKNRFSHDEQEALKADLEAIKAKLGIQDEASSSDE